MKVPPLPAVGDDDELCASAAIMIMHFGMAYLMRRVEISVRGEAGPATPVPDAAPAAAAASGAEDRPAGPAAAAAPPGGGDDPVAGGHSGVGGESVRPEPQSAEPAVGAARLPPPPGGNILAYSAAARRHAALVVLAIDPRRYLSRLVVARFIAQAFGASEADAHALAKLLSNTFGEFKDRKPAQVEARGTRHSMEVRITAAGLAALAALAASGAEWSRATAPAAKLGLGRDPRPRYLGENQGEG